MGTESALGQHSGREFSRLKALLFGNEQRFLEDLAARLERLDARAGDDERLRASVARILSDALRDAEVRDHERLAEAMAPVVVETIHAELVNSRDKMVEALYPITGRLVSAYVANAFKDLLAEINQRLESGLSGRRLYLRLKSLFVGRSYSELLLAELRAPRVEELYLVRRESGELIDRWQAPLADEGDPKGQLAKGEAAKGDGEATSLIPKGANGKEHLVSGFLSAITEFAREAFASDAGQLRSFDIEQHRIYVRASPAHLIAAKCRGVMPPGMERTLDEVFVAVLEQHGEVLGRGEEAEPASLAAVLPDFASRLQEALGHHDERAKSGNTLAIAFLSAIALALFGWIGWSTYGDWREARARAAVEEIIASEAVFDGFPVRVEAEDWGARIHLTGLAPSQSARERLIYRVRNELGPRTLDVSLVALPSLEMAQRFRTRLAAAQRRIAGLEAQVAKAARETDLETARGALGRLGDELQSLRRLFDRLPEARSLHGVIAAVTELESGVKALEDRLAEAISANRTAIKRLAADNRAALERLATDNRAALEQLATDTKAIVEKAAVENRARIEAVDKAARKRLQQAQAKSAARLAALEQRLDASLKRIAALEAGLGAAATKENLAATRRELAQLVATVAGNADKAAAAAKERAALDRRIRGLERRLPGPREKLLDWMAQNAIFFTQGTTYRDPEVAAQKLARLARLQQKAASRIRIVGYTDFGGNALANQRLSQARAVKVAGDLVALGVPAASLEVVGRADNKLVTRNTEPGNANRRVEFEPVFDGERAAHEHHRAEP